MLDDNLNKKKLAQMIGTNRFDSVEAFAQFMKPKFLEELSVDENRLKQGHSPDKTRLDFYIEDDFTKREPLVIIGLKIVKLTPLLKPEDLTAFHQLCRSVKTLYSLLMTEQEVYFFQYQDDQVFELKAIKPLNHIEYDFEREITPDKLKDFIIYRKKFFIGIGLFLILLLSASLANASICKKSGIIKAEVTASGGKFYYLPDQSTYASKKTGDQSGERRFCSEKEALNAGWLKGL